MSLFWSIAATVFLAEMGDKTQLLMVAMASQYRVRDILPGVGAAVVLLNTLAVALGTLTGNFLPTDVIGLLAGGAFLYFAYATLGQDTKMPAEGGENTGKTRQCGGAIVTVGITFFLAELGDKTQLTALTLAAEHDWSEAIPLLFGASLGLYVADILGFLFGFFLGREIPAVWFSRGSFAVFVIFGLTRIQSALYASTTGNGATGLLSGLVHGRMLSVGITFVLTVSFLLLCFWKHIRSKRKIMPADVPSEHP